MLFHFSPPSYKVTNPTTEASSSPHWTPVTSCTHYFPAALIEHHNQKPSMGESWFWLVVTERWVYQAAVVWQQANQEAEGSHLQQKAESTHWKWSKPTDSQSPPPVTWGPACWGFYPARYPTAGKSQRKSHTGLHKIIKLIGPLDQATY